MVADYLLSFRGYVMGAMHLTSDVLPTQNAFFFWLYNNILSRCHEGTSLMG